MQGVLAVERRANGTRAACRNPSRVSGAAIVTPPRDRVPYCFSWGVWLSWSLTLVLLSQGVASVWLNGLGRLAGVLGCWFLAVAGECAYGIGVGCTGSHR